MCNKYGIFMIAVVLSCELGATSLFDEASYQAIVTEKVGHQVGDLLTVMIYESSSATNTALTDTETGVDIGANVVDRTLPESIGLKLNNEFDGGGRINRTGKVIASMSVKIVDIKENGDYKINGEQKIRLNNESQFIKVSGLVRPQDISQENTILSTRIAEADIVFKGKGLLTSHEKPGIITRLFNWFF